MRRRPNDGLFEGLDKLSTFILANLLWVLLSIPLITLPLATAGLFTTMSLWARGQPTEVFRDFFRGARKHWRTASLVGLLDLLIGGLIALNLTIFRLMNPSQIVVLLSQSATLFVALTVIAANLYLWPLMVMLDDLPLRRLIETSVKLVFAYPLWSLVMLILAALPLAVSLLLPAGALVLATFSALALLVSWGAWRILRRYIPAEGVENESAG